MFYTKGDRVMSKKMPNSVCWNITSRCNEKCKFCYRDRDSREVSFADKKKVIDRIVAAGIRKLTFAGGEPLLVENIRELILYAKSRGLMVSLTTNSILLKGEILDFCLQELDWLTMSLDGDSNATQSRMTRHGKHFDRVMEVLAYAAVYPERNCRIKLNTVVSNKNQNEVKNMVPIVLEKGVERWKLFQFVPLRGAARENGRDFEISDESFSAAAEAVKTAMGEKANCVSVCDRESIEHAHFVIFPNGDIKISDDLHDRVLGNALQDDLQQLWAEGGYNRESHDTRTAAAVA